mgnify:CR=1 FL=1
MRKKDKFDCLSGIMTKLDKIENHINKMHEGISRLRIKIAEGIDPEEEICLDEIQADKALLESIEDICLAGLLEREPEGDA